MSECASILYVYLIDKKIVFALKAFYWHNASLILSFVKTVQDLYYEHKGVYSLI